MPNSFFQQGITWLNRPYPAPKGEPKDLLVAILFGAFIALFLLFFEPFDLNVLRYENWTLTVSFYGVITAGVLVLGLFLIPKGFPGSFQDQHWQIKHQLLLYVVILWGIATCNGMYINYLNQLDFSWANYGWIITRTFGLGLIPFTVLTLWDYNRKLHFYLAQAQELNQQAKPPSPAIQGGSSISLENNKYQVTLREDDFLYLEADGNYLTLFQLNQNHLQKEVYRNALHAVEVQLQVPYIQRCHRSYIVNLKQVIQVTGNAQGLKLTLQGSEQLIPVSRKYLPQVKAFLMNQPNGT